MKIAISHKAIVNSLIVFLLCVNSVFAQFTIPEKPELQTSVYDYANLLSSQEKAQLEEKLVRYSDSTSTQIVVITIESLKGEYIGELAPKWGQKWGIGQAKEDNGVIIMVAKAEHKVWISAGYGLEDKLTAGTIGQELIRDVIAPEFKAGRIYDGLDKGTDAIFQILKGKYKGTRKSSEEKGIPPLLIIVIVIIILILISRGNRGRGSGIGRQPSLLDMIILSNLGRSSGSGFGGSSGGGFGGGGFGGGFGGGGFSGGGAGGDW